MSEDNEQPAPRPAPNPEITSEPTPHITSAPLEPIEDEVFFIVDDESTEPDGIEEGSTESELADELDGMRIRKLSQARRSNVRSQTYSIVGMISCVVAGIKLGLMAKDSYAIGRWLSFAGDVAIALASIVGAALFAMHADRLRDELNQPPATTDHIPDFSTLSDGSQHVRNLHDMHEAE